jgi:ABC-type oligopeptide transport system substrate-binding subunit
VRGIAGLESPLVGREAEFRALRAALERMQNGVGGIVTVVGEAGIGKSRLVAEVRKVGATHLQGDGPSPFARALHLRWVEGRCLSYGRSIAYLLWLDVLRGLLGVTVEDAPAVVRDALEERVRALFPDSFDPVEEAVYPCLARLLSLPLAEEAEVRLEELDGRELRDCTFGALEAVLAWAAQEQPLVLVCEDLHWADPTSLQLLEHLLPLAEQHPLLILCLLRPVRDHGSWRLREVILQEHAQRHTALWLEPLSVGESEMLVGNLLWIESLSAELKKTILSRAEGNPFYLEEILRSLIDQGAIVQDPASGRWQPLADVERIAIPGTLEGVLVARIDRLHEKTRRVLQLASVIGRIFPYRILAAIAKEERELDRRLLTLQQEEMIRERARLPELEYIFKHDLTREAAYNGLLKRDRRVYHRQVAEALERLFPERAEEQLGLLAHHWERAGDAEKAVEYLLQAGDRARRLYAHQEAIRAYERALVRLKEQGDHEQAARTMMKLGLAHHNAFQFQQSRQAYDEGFALWRRAGEVQAAVGHLPAPHALRLFWYDLPTLDWALHQTVENSAQLEHLFSGLVALTPELDVVPDVARSWEVLDGGRKYLFHLRDDVHWSDGVPVTAGDFEYAWRRLLNPGTSLEIVSMLDAVAGAKALHRGDVADPASLGVCALDDRTLLVELEGPTAHFLQLLAEYTAFPVPRHALEAHGEAWVKLENIVTNGPFRLEAWQRGESMVLVRNPNYHGPFTGNVERIELCLLPLAEWPEILQRYQDDRLDVLLRLWFLPPEQRNRTQQHYAGEALSIPALHTGAVWFNGKRPPFSDVNVRRAFVLAADRKALLDAVWPDWTPASGGFIPPSMPGHSPGIALSYDPQKARKLLADAGYPAARGFPTLRALTWHGAEPTMEYLQDQWRENLGIEMQWDAVPFGELWDESHEKQVHVWSFAWQADYPDPDNFLRAGQRGCLTGWCSEAYDRLVEEARRSMDQAKRMKLFGQADRILMEDAVLMPYCHARWKLLVKPWVKRYPTSPMRQWFWKDVVIEPH